MIITGKVKIVKKTKDYYEIDKDVIIVAVKTTPDIVVVIHHVKAIITEVESKLSHAAIIAREYDKPLLMGVKNATKKFKNGRIITINTKTKQVICF